MKFTLEQFDFKNLSDDSILMIEVAEQTKLAFEAVQRTAKALIDSGKIPKGTLILISLKSNPVNLKEIPKEVMNQNGWFKMKAVIENASVPLPPATSLQTESKNHPH
jgi:membrane-bound lytic murein transglycosylase